MIDNIKKISKIKYLKLIGINPTGYELNSINDCDSLRDLLDKYFKEAPWCYNLNLTGELEEALNNHNEDELVYIESINSICEI